MIFLHMEHSNHEKIQGFVMLCIYILPVISLFNEKNIVKKSLSILNLE